VLGGSALQRSVSTAMPTLPDVFEKNRRLGRGVNVLGYDPLWKDRTKARFQAEHFKLIHEAGFSHVRINLFPFRDSENGNGETIGEAYLRTLDWALDGALANHLLAILDFHEFRVMSADPVGNKGRFLSMWKQIAERCKERPGEVMFEILNEPHGKLTPELWNDYLRAALAIIRDSNPNRTVVVGPGFCNNVGHLGELKLPEEDHNLIVAVHYYEPMQFTHQGAAYAAMEDKVGVPWDGTPQERQVVTRDFEKVQAWAKEHQRPIYLGEFGAYDKAEMAARARYADCVAREAERLGWSWAWWQFDDNFIVYDIRSKQWVPQLRNALIPPTAQP